LVHATWIEVGDGSGCSSASTETGNTQSEA
jgi:hypothetical protein